MAPLGQASSAEDVGSAVVYAANARAITGTTLLVDGGQHLQRMARDLEKPNAFDDAEAVGVEVFRFRD